jgi:hypothetical protein
MKIILKSNNSRAAAKSEGWKFYIVSAETVSIVRLAPFLTATSETEY